MEIFSEQNFSYFEVSMCLDFHDYIIILIQISLSENNNSIPFVTIRPRLNH